ncbi:hypothetical protein, partial [Limosilactobacillus reuteri]|uniref:hypothetical protein n=1 Tax=Limosilactobacillus reuteri TaxID=1598 RepID=UPI003EB9AAB6|nr:hypothetical protein [Limosilactobacillus reuteri]
PSTNNQLVSIIYLSPVANLFLKFRNFKYLSIERPNSNTEPINKKLTIAFNQLHGIIRLKQNPAIVSIIKNE